MLNGNYKILYDHLIQKIDKKRIYHDPLYTLAYGTDASFYRLIPKLVIIAKDEYEVSLVLSECTNLSVPVTFCAAGTSLSGQSISDSVLLIAGSHWKKFHIRSLAQSASENKILSERIGKKYKIKNTTGYSLNALIDYRDPFDIIEHLMIGSEGTLGFISEINYKTVIEYRYKASSLIIFPDMENACNAVTLLKASPVSAVELIDRAGLRSVEDEKGISVVHREIISLKRSGREPHIAAALAKSFNYSGDETCATDGLCATSCTVKIDTGKLIKNLRSEKIGTRQHTAMWIANNMSLVTSLARRSLSLVHIFHNLLGTPVMNVISEGLRKASGNRIPMWNPYMPKGATIIKTGNESGYDTNLKVVYFPSCINRSMGNEPVEFISEFLLPHLTITPLNETITVFPVCSMKKMELAGKLEDLARKCAENVIMAETNCCGFAGDRGFTFPELNKHGLSNLKKQIPATVKDGYSTSRTCEIGLSLHIGISYKSIVYLVDKVSSPNLD